MEWGAIPSSSSVRIGKKGGVRMGVRSYVKYSHP